MDDATGTLAPMTNTAHGTRAKACSSRRSRVAHDLRSWRGSLQLYRGAYAARSERRDPRSRYRTKYAYVGSDPANGADPTGTEDCRHTGTCPSFKRGGPASPSLQGTAATGAAAGVGAQISAAGENRGNYDAAVGQLDPSDSAGRSALKEQFRQSDPPLVRGPVEKARPSTGPKEGSGGRANVPNARVSALGAAARVAGPVVVGVSAAVDAAAISSSPQPFRELAARSGAMLGGTLGGLGGAVGGTAVAPGGGTLAGGVLGAAGGAKYGEIVATGLYDRVNGD
jgi:hypothetical protein